MQTVTITKWGNSQGIRIPVDILKKANVRVADFRHKSFSERLAAYNGKIETCDFEWGEPMGKEGL